MIRTMYRVFRIDFPSTWTRFPVQLWEFQRPGKYLYEEGGKALIFGNFSHRPHLVFTGCGSNGAGGLIDGRNH